MLAGSPRRSPGEQCKASSHTHTALGHGLAGALPAVRATGEGLGGSTSPGAPLPAPLGDAAPRHGWGTGSAWGAEASRSWKCKARIYPMDSSKLRPRGGPGLLAKRMERSPARPARNAAFGAVKLEQASSGLDSGPIGQAGKASSKAFSPC